MSEEHTHEQPQRIRFTIVFQPTWWGWQGKLTIVGTGSHLEDGKLTIVAENGGFTVINYAHVRWLTGVEI